jgi:hypothetical protein
MCEIAIDGNQPQKRNSAGIVVGSHVGALALLANKEVVRRHLVDGLAHGPLTYTETQRKFLFAGNRLPRTPLARLQSIEHQILDLTVERAEGGRVRSHSCIEAHFWLTVY